MCCKCLLPVTLFRVSIELCKTSALYMQCMNEVCVFCTATQAWRHKFAKIAKEYPSFSFAVADEEENSDLFHDFGFDESSEEVNVGILGPNDRRYPMEPMEEFESDEVMKFLRTYMKGVLTVHCSTFLLVTSALYHM